MASGITDVARRARWKRAWEMHFAENKTWHEVGEVLGVSAERARQLANLHRRHLPPKFKTEEKQ